MNRRMIRWLSLMLAGIMFLLFGCGRPSTGDESNSSSDTEEPKKVWNLLDFEIVRADKASQQIIDAVRSLNSMIKDKVGKTLLVKTDFWTDPETDFEILIGDVDRSQAQALAQELNPGDYAIKSIMSENGMKLVLGGANEKLLLKAVEELKEMLDENLTVAENGTLASISKTVHFYQQYQNFSLEISDPYVVVQSGAGETRWGYYQFPCIYRNDDGSIRVTWALHDDAVDAVGNGSYAVSTDGGKTWAYHVEAGTSAQ